jgi:hypothetical protein
LNKFNSWEKIHEIISNDADLVVDLENTSLGSGTLPKIDEVGEEVFHYFKVSVENSSGILSLDDRVLTI